LQKLIEIGRVEVNTKRIKANYKLREGDTVSMTVPDPEVLSVVPQSIPLNVIYEDEHLLVVDKSAGMVTHPAPGNPTETLVNALLYHCSDLPGINGVERPGIVHRLDKETSGLIVVAKTNQAQKSLGDQFKARNVKKQYLALVKGVIQVDRGVIDSAIGRHKFHRKKMSINEYGRKALTEYEIVNRYDGYTFLRLFPKTGRTHQIRVHLASIGHPILGDKLYGGDKTAKNLPQMDRHALHSSKLEFDHPATAERMNFEAPVPADFNIRGFFKKRT
tara:strand:+ start:141 stop:965 length:825 start_codon:yes stop_codon:yes gene_type:complete